MFANTLTLTINAVAKVLTRVNQDSYGSEYTLISYVESIRLQIRHTTDKLATGDVLRHNVYVERTIFATPTATEKYFSVTGTLRSRVGSSPTDLLNMYVGFSTLMATLDDGLVVGEN
jgi:hypothetical protein